VKIGGYHFRVDGSLSSRQAWNLTQSGRLKSGRSGRIRKDDRHLVSISTVKCPGLSAEHVFRYTGVTKPLVNTMSRNSVVEEELYGLVMVLSGP
jgi:hypothetical protein